jgi:hypothetical protein
MSALGPSSHRSLAICPHRAKSEKLAKSICLPLFVQQRTSGTESLAIDQRAIEDPAAIAHPKDVFRANYRHFAKK